jgi:DNA repair exonuclease SbcCD ATPase subunit
MIYFKTLRWKNFLSTGNSFTEIELNRNNTTLIVGENGAGKSTMLDALCFALYNKPFRKINKPQLMNSINKKDLIVEIEFEIGASKYKVVRGLKPSIFEVYQNGRMINQDAASKDYQDVLEKQILKLNHKSFCQVVVLGSASFVPFMELSAMHRREVIEDLLDIQIFSTMNSLLKDRVNNNNKELMEVEYKYDLNSEKIKMQQAHIDAMQKNTEEQITKFKNELNECVSQIDAEKNNLSEKDRRIADLQALIADESTITKKSSRATDLERQLKEKIQKLNHEIEFFNSHDNCPTCKQAIDSEFKCETINTRQSQVEETANGIELLRAEIESINNRIQEITDVRSQITALNMDKFVHDNNVNGLMKHCKKIAADIEELQKKSEEYAINDDLMKELETQLEELIAQKSEMLRDKDALFVASLVLKDNGIKARIIKQYVPVINKLINKYLAALDFFVMFELDENFNETIKSRFRDDFSYASFSEGEKMRINLAILFTWRAIAKLRNSASTNLLIMDEVLDGSLDSSGTDEFLKIISTLTQDTNTFIISHKVDQLYDKFNNVLKFEKHKNFSRIAA